MIDSQCLSPLANMLKRVFVRLSNGTEFVSKGEKETSASFSFSPALLRWLMLPGAAAAAGGVLLLIFSPDIVRSLDKTSWDSAVYYLEKLRFLGRTAIAAAFIWFLGLFMLRKGCCVGKIALTTAVIFGCVLQIDGYLWRDFWNDTMALTAWLKYSTWKELFVLAKTNPFAQAAPPGFLVLSKVAGEVFGFSKWSLTVLPLLFGFGALFKYPALAAKVLPLPGRIAALWLFALNPGVWMYAGEFKQYSADIFFTVWILFLALEYTETENRNSLKLMGVGIVSLLFSHAMFFVLPAVGFSLWAQEKFVFRKNLFFLLFVWAAAVLAAAAYTKSMMPPAMYVHEHHSAGFAPLPTSPEDLKWYWEAFLQLFSAPWNMVWKISFFVVFPLWGMLLGIKRLWKEKKVAVLSGILILMMLYLASVLHQYPLAAGLPFTKGRLILFTIPLAILIFSRSVTGRRALLWSIPVILSACLNICTSFMPFGNFSPAVKELVSRAAPDECVIVNSDTARFALLLYAPKGYFRDIYVLKTDKTRRALPAASAFHVFIVDEPAENLVVPHGFSVARRQDFTFSTVLTMKKEGSLRRNAPGVSD